MGAESIRIGRLTLQPRLQLLRDGIPLPLGARALDVLSALAAADGGVVTKDRLIDEVWDGAIVEENAIQAQISALRKALGDEARRLVTIHGRGYRLDLASAEPAAVVSVAVLPFDNLSDDPANGYLADGLADELIMMLSRLPGAQVPARTSSFAYRGRRADARTIGAELKVRHLVEGSVRVSGTRVRATIQLIDAASGFHEWAENFDRELTELLAVQDEMAAAIAAALEIELVQRDPPSRDLEAYHGYMQANSLMDRGRAEDMSEAIALYRAAIARDPGFAEAHGRLALTLLGASNRGFLPLSARGEAAAEANEATRLDNRLATAPMVLGGVNSLAGRWLAAEDHFRASLALDPRESHCHNMHAYFVMAPCGHLARAQSAVDRAFELAPAVPFHSLGRATMAGLRGDIAMVLQNLHMAVTLGLSPDEPGIRFIRAEAALLQRDWEEAAENVVATFPQDLREAGIDTARLVYRGCLGLADGARASAAAADLLADLSDEHLARFQVPVGTIMHWQAKLGALDAAFEVGERIVATLRRTGHLATMGLFQMWLPEMRAFRDDPRFGDLAAELGMVEYWRRHGPPDGYALRQDRLVAA
jgi:TolB-like protein